MVKLINQPRHMRKKVEVFLCWQVHAQNHAAEKNLADGSSVFINHHCLKSMITSFSK